jgi:plasmid stability protein
MCYTTFVETRNITFHLPVALIRRAKIYAAEHDTTVNALVRSLLDDALLRDDRSRTAATRILEIAKQGPSSSVDPATIRREELYERR